MQSMPHQYWRMVALIFVVDRVEQSQTVWSGAFQNSLWSLTNGSSCLFVLTVPEHLRFNLCAQLYLFQSDHWKDELYWPAELEACLSALSQFLFQNGNLSCRVISFCVSFTLAEIFFKYKWAVLSLPDITGCSALQRALIHPRLTITCIAYSAVSLSLCLWLTSFFGEENCRSLCGTEGNVNGADKWKWRQWWIARQDADRVANVVS